MGVIGPVNAIVSLLAALLGAAPFTPAIVLFVFTLPFAAWVASQGRLASSVAVIAFGVLAIALSPFHHGNFLSVGVLLSLAWVAGWGFVIVRNYRKYRKRKIEEQAPLIDVS